MFTFSLSTVVILVMAAVLAVIAGVWLFRKDTEIENRRRNMIDVAAKLEAYGLVELPAILKDYAVGDYSGVAYRIREMVRKFADPKQLLAEFDEVFSRVGAMKAKTPEGVAAIKALLPAEVK